MSTADAYTAAIIDGEGCIFIQKAAPKGRRKSPCHTLQLTVGNYDSRLTAWLQEQYGGFVTVYKGHHKHTFYQWHVSGLLAQIVLERVRPWMIVKRTQADVAIEFQRERAPQNGGSGKVLSDALVNYREQCRLRLKALKTEFPQCERTSTLKASSVP